MDKPLLKDENLKFDIETSQPQQQQQPNKTKVDDRKFMKIVIVSKIILFTIAFCIFMVTISRVVFLLWQRQNDICSILGCLCVGFFSTLFISTYPLFMGIFCSTTIVLRKFSNDDIDRVVNTVIISQLAICVCISCCLHGETCVSDPILESEIISNNTNAYISMILGKEVKLFP